MIPYLLLGLFALLSPAVTVGFYFLKKTKFNKSNYWLQQVIIGLVFGGIAVLCTEFGVRSNDAVMNVRDSAPILAGLVFGLPAGLISGFIGGLERFLSAYWRGTYYTQLACSISTFISGAVASLLYLAFFRKKRVAWYQGILVGAVCETSHILMIFVTNMDDTTTAFSYVSKIGNYMIIAVALSVGLGAGLMQIFNKEKRTRIAKRNNWQISHILQGSLFGAVLVAYLVMALFTYNVQYKIASTNTRETLTNSVQDVSKDIKDTSDQNLLDITHDVATNLETRNEAGLQIDNDYLMSLIDTSLLGGQHFDVSEINIIDENGIITTSSNLYWIGFDMNSGDQPKEFCDAILTNGQESFVQPYMTIQADSNIKMKYAGYKLTFSGFVQVGYNSEHFYDDLDSIIHLHVNNRRVGEHGFVLVADYNRNIVGLTGNVGEYATLDEIEFTISLDSLNLNQVDTTKIKVSEEIEGVHYIASDVEGYYILSFMMDKEIEFNREMSIYMMTYEQFIIFGVIYCIAYGIFSHFVFRDLENVNKGLKDITEGDLNVVLDSHYSREFGELNDSINKTVKTLKDINEKEMENAKAIQMSSLPAKEAYFDVHHFDIYAEMKTAKVVGGDFYDYFPLNKNTFVILIADVSGKGIPAALFMMRTKSLLKSLLETGMSIEEAVKHTNIQLCENNEVKMFVTCWIGLVHFDTGLVEFVNAGHNPPLIKQKGQFVYLRRPANLVLGASPKARYDKQLLILRPGDIIFLYTDGITEAKREDQEMYQEKRLLEHMNSLDTIDPKKITNSVLENTLEFVDGYEQSDDMTLLTLSYYGYARRYQYEYDGVLSSFSKAKEDLTRDLQKESISEVNIVKFIVCYDEIFSNCAKYAYARKRGKIRVNLDVTDMQICLSISDDGEAFNPLEKEEPDVTLELEKRQIGGLGIHVVKKFMDQYHYYYQDGHNVLILQKYRKTNKKGE